MNFKDQGTKALLIAVAAAEIKRADAPEEVTVRRIAAEAGVNLNAVNYHFGTKQNLIREAVREIIAGYFVERRSPPESWGSDFRGNLERVARFLFDEPVAARLALTSEMELGGAGPSLTDETMEAFAALLRGGRNKRSDEDARFRTWVVVAALHQFLLRSEGCRRWLDLDPRRREDLSALLDRLAALTE